MTTTTQAEAIFMSSLQPSDHPSAIEIVAAVRQSLRINGGTSGLVAAFAMEYGEHPEESATRMRWARSLVAAPMAAAA